MQLIKLHFIKDVVKQNYNIIFIYIIIFIYKVITLLFTDYITIHFVYFFLSLGCFN